MISCGAEHSFVITNKGEVYSWGLNIKGQLGQGNYDNISTPSLVFSLLPFGNSNAKARKFLESSNKKSKAADNNNAISPGLKERTPSIENVIEQI